MSSSASMPTKSRAVSGQIKRHIEPRDTGASAPVKIQVEDLNFFYGRSQALYNITLTVPERVVMAFIGPSGCGKSTFLRTMNRMNDTIAGTRAEGLLEIDG